MFIFGPPDIEKMIARMDERGLDNAVKYARKHGDRELEDRARDGWIEVTQLKMKPRDIQLKHAETRDPNPQVRLAAIKYLVSRRDGYEAICRLMDDPDLSVRRTVARAFASGGAQPGFYIKYLADPDEEIRVHAAQGLAHIEDWFPGDRRYNSSPEETMAALVSALKDTPKERAEAGYALSRLFGGSALPVIKQLAGDPNPEVRMKMAKGLMETLIGINTLFDDDHQSILFLFDLLKDEDAGLRASVVEGLKAIRAKHSKPDDPFWMEFADRLDKCLLEVMEARRADIRKEIQELEAAGDVPGLGLLLKSSDYEVAYGAAEALARLKSEAALECLISALKYDDCAAAIFGLGKSGDPRAAPPLLERLFKKGDWREDREQIIRPALEDLGEAALPSMRESLLKGGAEEKHKVLMALKFMTCPGVVDLLIEAYQNNPKDVSLETLAERKDPRVKAILVGILTNAKGTSAHDEYSVAAKWLERLGWQPGNDQAGAAYWIGKYKWEKCLEIGEPAIGPLLEALQDGRAGAKAAEILGRLGARQAIPALRAALATNAYRYQAVGRFDELKAEAKKALALLGETV